MSSGRIDSASGGAAEEQQEQQEQPQEEDEDMTSARALWTAQRGRLPCWPADAMSCCPVIAGRAVSVIRS